MKIRVVTTASKAKAVQVVSYQGGKRLVLKHIGSAHTQEALKELVQLAEEWVKDNSGQRSIFPDEDPSRLLHLNHCTFVGVKYRFFHQQVKAVQALLKLDGLPALLNDLVAMRIFEPASKLRSLELLEQFFAARHSRKAYYKMAPGWPELKADVGRKVVDFAKAHYGLNFDILFYDVTTLYFESFQEDGLRKNGFSKDNKSQQPQIVVALMVGGEGFPLAYQVFPGNTFEGHTIIPFIKDFIACHAVKAFTVVADAAMISSENVRQLTREDIGYIVGARLASIPEALLGAIDQNMARQDGQTLRIKTDKGDLVCGYSSARHRKDKHEMEKQLEKARKAVANPATSKKLKFTQAKGQQIELNQALIDKTQKLLGIKGYYTNLDEAVAGNQAIIERYHELYRIEQAFRMSKSDLQTRPIFHFKEQPIKLHLLVCFMALVISKHIELKTKVSIRKFIQEAKKVVDGEILNHATGKVLTIKAEPTPKMKELLAKLNAPH